MTQKNVLCKPDLGATSNNDASTSEKAAQTEFSAMTGINLRKGKSDLKAACESILEANNVHETVCNQKTLKQLIQS